MQRQTSLQREGACAGDSRDHGGGARSSWRSTRRAVPTEAGKGLAGSLPANLRKSPPVVSWLSGSHLLIKSSACHPFCWWDSVDRSRKSVQSLGA